MDLVEQSDSGMATDWVTQDEQGEQPSYEGGQRRRRRGEEEE